MSRNKKIDYTVKVLDKEESDTKVTLNVEICKDAWDCIKEKKENSLCRLVLIALE